MDKRRRDRLTEDQPGESSTKVGWRMGEWCRDTGLSRSFAYELIGAGVITSVKAGNARIITTSPAQYIAALAGDPA
jgi:hypothetical protein